MASPIENGVVNAALVALLKGKIPPNYIPRADWPSDDTAVESGVYVSDVYTVSRTPFIYTFDNSGAYTVNDEFWIKYIDQQDSGYIDLITGVIEDFANSALFKQYYHDVTYTSELDYENRGERYTYTFNLLRTELR